MIPVPNSLHIGDCLDVLKPWRGKCVQLSLFSPPYERARTYGIGFKLAGQDYVDWLAARFLQALRVTDGLVACVMAGQTRDRRWSATPALLMADLHRAGVCLRNPPAFHRIGIPGSGGDDWLRGDYETIVCATHGGKIPWSDNTACGHPPRWAPGGAMSHRPTDGTRKNQWGHAPDSPSCRARNVNGERVGGQRPSHYEMPWGSGGAMPETRGGDVERRDRWGSTGHPTSARGRKANGEFKTRLARSPATSRAANGDRKKNRLGTGQNLKGGIAGPDIAIANPGNFPSQLYTADEVAELLGPAGDVTHHRVGGGVMGDRECHANEAPFPETLADFFIRSFCPPGGTVLDICCGSGTTCITAARLGRKWIGVDVRQSQIDLTRQRLGLFAEAAS